MTIIKNGTIVTADLTYKTDFAQVEDDIGDAVQQPGAFTDQKKRP